MRLRNLSILLALSTAACTSPSAQKQAVEQGARCPEVGFIKGYQTTPENGDFDFALANFDGGCLFEDGKVIVETKLKVVARAKEADEDGAYPKRVEVPYFAAIVNPSEDGITRQDYIARVPLKFGEGQKIENLRHTIPRKDVRDAGRYTISFGLILPETE